MKLTVAGLALVAAGTLALVGCQTTSLDTTVQQSLPKVCAAADVAHAAFLTYVAEAKVSAKDQRTEAAAYESLAALCADPSSQSSTTVLVAAANAYASITAALHDAKE